jgi:glycosyltransferase involved in cell wall biosynthesis
VSYSIIIPIHNEAKSIPSLISSLEYFSQDNEILIVDDGSTDQSALFLKKCSFITLISIPKNKGKGNAIQSGIKNASHEKIILFDGDLEMDLREMEKGMILNKNKNIDAVFGARVQVLNPFVSLLDFGNFFLNGIFNFIHQKHFTDVLCGCKAFYKSDINLNSIQSYGFDIDVEIASILVKNNCNIMEFPIQFNRRSVEEGKKLKMSDGWIILSRLLIPK